MHRDKIATIFGGTGFLGRQIVRELAAQGVTVKVATRVPERAYFLKPCGSVGQVVAVPCDYSNAGNVHDAVKGSDFVINCIGILYEKGKRSTFQRAHVDVPAMIAKACADENVARFVHVSALGCDTGASRYAKTKLDGEKAVLSNYAKATILRPSVMFGEDDHFFNKFAEMSRYVPFLPLIGGGKTKFHPVFVGDVADAALRALSDNSRQYQGKVYQLGGPAVLDFKDIYAVLFKHTGRERRLVSVPFALAKFQARFLSLLSWLILAQQLLTPDQVESLKTDNVVEKGALGFGTFGIEPKSMDLILPRYLGQYKSGGRFSKLKAA